MISIENPSMAINTKDINFSIKLWNTMTVESTMKPFQIIQRVVQVAQTAPAGKLENLVISCHGFPGYLYIGDPGIDINNVGIFKKLAGLVGKIWFTGCLVARIPDEKLKLELKKSDTKTDPNMVISDGNVFCSQVAKHAQSYVVASTEIQSNNSRIYLNELPSYEGLVVSYGPDGKISWQHRYSSNQEDNRE